MLDWMQNHKIEGNLELDLLKKEFTA